MASDPDPNIEHRKLTVLALLLKPVEYGMIGMVVIAVLWSAQKLQVLPKTFKGFGVEVEIPQDQAEVIQESFKRIDMLEADVSKLRTDLANVAKSAVTFGGSAEVSAQAISEVAQDTLVAAPLSLEKKSATTGVGYVWIGTFSPEGNWLESSVAAGEALKNLPHPNDLSATQQTMRIDTNLRDAAPQDNATYFSQTKRLGFVPAGTIIDVTSKPLWYKRSGVSQIWAEVKTSYKPL